MINKILNINFEKKQLDDTGIFSGYASNFGNVDSHNDVILSGAFGQIKDVNSIGLLWQHDPEKPIGNIIELVEDDEGLFVTAKLFLTDIYGLKVYNMLKKGSANGLSVGYKVLKSFNKDNKIRYIEAIELVEISLVNFPSNPKSRVIEVKNIEDQIMLSCSLDRAINILRN